jgi:hypothetical protein
VHNQEKNEGNPIRVSNAKVYGFVEKLETDTEDHDSTLPRSPIVFEKTVAGTKNVYLAYQKTIVGLFWLHMQL